MSSNNITINIPQVSPFSKKKKSFKTTKDPFLKELEELGKLDSSYASYRKANLNDLNLGSNVGASSSANSGASSSSSAGTSPDTNSGASSSSSVGTSTSSSGSGSGNNGNSTSNGGTGKGDGNGGRPGAGQKAMAWAQGIGSTAGSIAPLVQAFGGNKIDEDSTYQTEQGVGDALLSVPTPYTAIAGAAVKLISGLKQATDTDINTMSDKQASEAGLNKWQKLGNNVGAFWSNIGGDAIPFLSGLIKKTDKFAISDAARSVGGGYGDTMDFINTMQSMGGKRYLFGEVHGKINDAKSQAEMLASIGLNNRDVVSSVPVTSSLMSRQNYNDINDINYGYARGKEGMKLLSKEELQRIYSAKKVESDITKFENGGSIMIPDGSLHAHKNHIEDSNPELGEELTKKGIPVITTDENAEVQQVAEIEKEEIIFEKSLTEKIEELRKDGSEESMIECGKIIVCALFTDSTDNANLIKSVK